MSAMHHDTSSDLKVVGDKLRDILEVFLLPSSFFFSYKVGRVSNYVTYLHCFRMTKLLALALFVIFG